MKITFSFGRNWKNYINNVVNEKVIGEAKESLLKYLPVEEYKGKTFIDIGCRSGLFSLSALMLACEKVISFDIDENSIEAAKMLKEKFSYLIPKKGKNWDIFQGDIMDETLVNKLSSQGDIVYSWGVLHHAGNMWKAIENALKLVKNNVYFIVSIYNYAPSSEFWLKVKKFYNNNPILQPFLIFLYGGYNILRFIIEKKTLRLRKERGMHVFYDAIDWLGGLPYEFACFDEIKDYVEKFGFKLLKAPIKLPCGKNKKVGILGKLRTKDTGCNEFVFQKV